MKVQFNSTDEFLDELRMQAQQCDRILGDVLRVTRLYHSVHHLPLHRLSVVATARFGDTVLRLDAACGQIMGDAPGEPNERVHARAAEIEQALERGANAAAMEIRAGLLEP